LRGVEVLARWKQPHGKYISPAAFIPLAEKSGLIVPLTQSLMNQVVTQMNAIASKLPEGFREFTESKKITLDTLEKQRLQY
ncbi:EAL domain-containing protein, partial [Escherichia coli]|nr:EAL domain-containing protein [Escherichia coli]